MDDMGFGDNDEFDDADEASVIADFSSPCGSCMDWIEPGDEIRKDRLDGWVHVEC